MAPRPSHRDPLAPRWLACAIEPPRAGATTTARVVVENAGSATWRSTDEAGIRLAYHWLDRLDNPIVWDGERTLLPAPLAPGATLEIELPVTAPRAPGRYRLAVDLVEEHRFWLEEIGCAPIAVDVEVRPLIDERRLGVVVHGGDDPRTRVALAAQDEAVVEAEPVAIAHLVAGAEPEPGWSRLLLDAHAEGYAAVGPAIAAGRRDRSLAAWAPGGGRNPRFGAPLLLPSLVVGLGPSEHLGLPAFAGDGALFEGRAIVRLPTRSGRRPG